MCEHRIVLKKLQLHQKLGLLNVGLMGIQMYLGSEMYDENPDNIGESDDEDDDIDESDYDDYE